MKYINWETAADIFVDAVASDSATPGGGSAGAIVAATGCGLCMMAIMVTMKRKDTAPQDKKILNAALDDLLVIKDKLKAGAAMDAQAYEKVVSARKLPKESKEREAALTESLQAAALVPADTARAALEAAKKAAGVESKIWPVIMSDIVCGKLLLKSAMVCLIENIKANAPYIKNEEFKKKLRENINFLTAAAAKI